MTSCIGEPISWLRLERHALRELSPREAAEIDLHLERCPACREVAAHRDARPIAMPRFDPTHRPTHRTAAAGLPKPARPVRRWGGLFVGLGVCAAAAAVVLTVQRGDDGVSGGGVKGADLGVELVREQGGVELDAGVFAAGDRFRVRATCPPGAMSWDVLVVQGTQGFFPLAGGALACGNRVALPGAFTLTGREPALVCLVLAPGAIDRATLMRDGRPRLPDASVCKVVVPAGA